MKNPLHPIWEAYLSTIASYKVVRRCVQAEPVVSQPLGNTLFRQLPIEQVTVRLDQAASENDDQTVLMLYATFEATLRERLRPELDRLRSSSSGVPSDLGDRLADTISDHLKELRMDVVVDLFRTAVGETLISKVGTIRSYRHWLAHGRPGPTPPRVDPLFAYQSLTRFLELCSLA